MGTKVKADYYIGQGGNAGIPDNLLVEGSLYANQTRLDFDKTTKTYKPIILPKYSILEKAVMVVELGGTTFDGTLKLGHSGDDEAYIANADAEKTAGHGKVYLIDALIQAATTIQFKVAGCSAGAKGHIWLLWRPLV
jgi:hypothetical protein